MSDDITQGMLERQVVWLTGRVNALTAERDAFRDALSGNNLLTLLRTQAEEIVQLTKALERSGCTHFTLASSEKRAAMAESIIRKTKGTIVSPTIEEQQYLDEIAAAAALQDREEHR